MQREKEWKLCKWSEAVCRRREEFFSFFFFFRVHARSHDSNLLKRDSRHIRVQAASGGGRWATPKNIFLGFICIENVCAPKLTRINLPICSLRFASSNSQFTLTQMMCRLRRHTINTQSTMMYGINRNATPKKIMFEHLQVVMRSSQCSRCSLCWMRLVSVMRYGNIFWSEKTQFLRMMFPTWAAASSSQDKKYEWAVHSSTDKLLLWQKQQLLLLNTASQPASRTASY